MGRVNKKKITKLNDSSVNSSKINRKKYIKTYKRVERSTSANNDSSTVNTRDTPRNLRSKSMDEPESKKTVLTSRKRKPTVEPPLSSGDDDESDNAPLNGSLASVSGKNSRKLTKKAKTPAKGKSGGSTNGGGDTGKFAKKNVETNDSEMSTDDEKEYEIEKVLGEKMIKGVRHFLVRWKGYNEASNSWAPEHTLFCEQLIEEYRSETLSKKQKKSTPAGKAKKVGIRNSAGASNAGARRKLPGRNPVDKKTDGEPDSEEEWEVKEVVGCIDKGSGRYYKIRWKGYNSRYDSWEPESNLCCNELIAKYHKIKAENVEAKYLREDPKKTQRLVNETIPRSNLHNKIGRSSKRSVTKHRVFYGED